MDRISLAVMSASSDEITPKMASPTFTDHVEYTVSLGVKASGEEITGEVEKITWENFPGRPGRIVWYENEGAPDERSVVWSNWVPDLFMNEEVNGTDDNNNNLPDEGGLA